MRSPTNPKNRAGKTSNAMRSIKREAPELYSQFFYSAMDAICPKATK